MNAVWVLIISLAIVCAPSPTITMSASTSSMAIVLYEDANATNWTITIGHLTGFINGLSLTDVCITIRKANGVLGVMTTAISDLTPDSYLNGFSYHNGGNPKQLNEWDYFILNKTIYENESSMIITSSDGKSTFASFTIGVIAPAPPRPTADYLPIITLISIAGISAAVIALYFHRKRKAGDK